MLVFTRRVGEDIVIATDIRVTVTAIGNGRVKIGIDAPSGVNVDRSEIHERKLAEAKPGGDVLAPPQPVATMLASTPNAPPKTATEFRARIRRLPK